MSVLLLESSDKLLLEDGSSFLLLEEGVSVDVIAGELEFEGAFVELVPVTYIDVIPGEIELEGVFVGLIDRPGIEVTAGEIEFEGVDVMLVPRMIVNVIPGNIYIHGGSVYSELNEPETAECLIMIDLLPESLLETTTATGIQKQLGRLTVDDVEIPIREFQLVEQKERIDTQIRVILGDVADRTAITSTASIKFELGTWSSGVMIWETMIDEGELLSTTHDITRNGAQPGDQFTFTGLSSSTRKLATTSVGDTVIYDPLKLTLESSDFETITDNFGRTYGTSLNAIANLKLYDLFQIVFVTGCGFASFNTNIPNYPISRVDFKIGEPLINPLAKYIGMFEADMQEIGSTIWLRDTTLEYGGENTQAVTVSRMSQLGIDENIQRVDALEMTYAELRNNYDTTDTETLTVIDNLFSFGSPSCRIVTETTLRHYYRNSIPDRPIASEIESKVASTYYFFMGQIQEEPDVVETENFYYDSYGRELRRTLVKVIVILRAQGVTWTFTERDEDNRTTWLTHPLKADQVYPAKREEHQRRHITLDAVSPYFGAPFAMRTTQAHQSGLLTGDNVEDGGYLGLTDINIEEMRPITRDTVQVTRKEIDALAGLVKSTSGVMRVGDIGVSSLVFRQERMPVFKSIADTRDTSRYFEPFNVGELPLQHAIPLGVRVLRNKQTRPRQVSMSVIGCDTSLAKGTTIEAMNREGDSLGIYSIEGRTLTGKLGNYFTQLECRQIGE